MAHHEQDQESFYRSQSFWLDSVPGRLTPRPALDTDIQADVVIVGAGYTGLWTAWYLKTHAPHLDVVLLEAEIAGFGASGRNGGWCTAYLSGIHTWLDAPETREAAVDLQRLMFGAVDEVGRVSCLENIDCHFDKSGHVAAAVNATQLERDKAEVQYWHSMGFSDEDMRFLDAGEVTRRVRINGALGGYAMHHCAAIHPARLARGLARAVVSRGVKLYETSPVTHLTDHGVATRGGTVTANAVLLATEGFTGSIAGMDRRLIPVHSLMIATEPLSEEEKAATGLRRRHTWNNGKHRVTYGQLTHDGRIAFGSRGNYRWGSGVNTSFETRSAIFEEVRQELVELFPVLANKAVTHRWGGPMGVARTVRPAVCFDPERGFGWAGGYFGDGVCATNLAGRTLADLVLKRDTARSRALWVNPPEYSGTEFRRWEIEPLRWLAIAARYRLMGWADHAEAKNLPSAKRWNHLLERFFP